MFIGPQPIITDGLVLALDPSNIAKHGNSPYTNLAGNGSIVNNNFEEINNIFRSDCVNSVNGNSQFEISGIEINTGSVTVQWFMNVTSDPDVGDENSWRRLIAKNDGSRAPFGFVLERSLRINFTIDTENGSKRHIDGGFTHYDVPLNTWEMHTFTYDKTTGLSACYQNDILRASGPQTNGETNPTVAGEAMDTLTSDTIMTISNTGVNDERANGDGPLPADLGYWLIYNKALTNSEVARNFNTLKTRYGI